MQLKNLKRISPSRFSILKKCALRAVLANSVDYPLLPYPPANHLGNVIHNCIHLILTDKITTNDDFNSAWDHLVTDEEQKLKDMGYEFLVPLSENVSGFTIKKLQTKALLVNQRKRESHLPENNSEFEILTEKWLEAKDKLIGGYIDIILTVKGYTKISDFKSGKIFFSEGEIKVEYEEQLKLYAYLYNETFGRYPDDLSIIDLEKKEYSVVFTPTEYETIAKESRELLIKVNRLIDADEISMLANPSLEICKNCLNRPACLFHWNLPISETDLIFRDIKGKVISLRQFRNGNLNVILNNDGMELLITHVSNQFSSFLNELLGKEVAFYNIKQNEVPGRFQALKTTRVYEK